jgi:L-threonylcarbamoyladenylate synthase
MFIKIKKFNPASEKETIDAACLAADVVYAGGVIIFPTDTCYGLAANIADIATFNRAYELKGRDFNKPFNLMVKDPGQFKIYGQYSPLIDKILKKYAGYLFAFVVKRTSNLPVHFNRGLDTVGIVMPQHPFCQRLFDYVTAPILGTSANVSGQGECYSVEELLKQFPPEREFSFPVAIFDAGVLPRRRPSTVIKILDDEHFEVLRTGDAGDIKII